MIFSSTPAQHHLCACHLQEHSRDILPPFSAADTAAACQSPTDQPPCASSCTCVCSRAALSCAGSRLWCEGHPRSGSPASAACPASPSLLVPGVPCLAGARRTGASPRSSLPSSAAGHWHCGRTRRAGRAVYLSWCRAQRPQSGNLGSLTRSRFQLQSLQTASWS